MLQAHGVSNRFIEPLTQREREILDLLAQGLTDREIAERLILALGTVKWYNKQLYSKLSVHSRSEAVVRARELGLLQDTGAPLQSGVVTFLFTDIEGSTKLWHQHPEVMRRSLERHDALLHRAIEANDGRVFKTVGDAFCAVFHDAAKALSAAHAAQIALMAQDWRETPIRIRIALHTGTADIRDDDYFGPPLNHVARLLSSGHGGQILVSVATRVLVQSRLPDELSFRDLGEHHLKDLGPAEKIYQLVTPDLPADFPPLNTLDSYLKNLPAQLTSFVGRNQEIKTVNQLLASSRLLTLSGPPGTGKTRLAIHVAKLNSDRFQDGVFFVDLAPINDPQLVLSTIAHALNLKEAPRRTMLDTLTCHLNDKQMLLLLDNFEQVIDAAPLIADLLVACPKLKALVTSREPMRVYGEQEYPVPPLAVPDSSYPEPPQVLAQYEAVELFCQRAAAVKPDFVLTEVNASSVSEICVRLDGLPLAIELAAARSKVLTPESMRLRLESRLLTLTGGARDLPTRMQTLRAAIDWSYDLLNEDEQRLFDRLSVFQGGRTIEAVEAICNSDLSFVALDGIESLLNKNLLFCKEGRTGETRFYMLETIHEYAREKLAQSGGADDLKTRHAFYFVSLAERAETELHGPRQEYWYARLTDEMDNIRTVLDWALDDANLELGARLVAALREFWYWKGLLSESSTWIKRALEIKGTISPAVLAKTLNAASRLAYARGDHAVGKSLGRQTLNLTHDINDKENCAWANLFLGSHLMFFDDQLKEATTHAEEALRLFREIDHKPGVANGLNMLGELARLDGDYQRASRHYKECLTLAREMGDNQLEAKILGNLSYVAFHQGNFDRAINYCAKALNLISHLQLEYANAISLAMIAGPIGAKGEPELAARLLATSETQLEAMGATVQPADRLEVDQFKEAIRQQLEETEFNSAWQEGRAMPFEDAIVYVLRYGID